MQSMSGSIKTIKSAFTFNMDSNPEEDHKAVNEY